MITEKNRVWILSLGISLGKGTGNREWVRREWGMGKKGGILTN
jgi:hypothetical protein